MFVYMPRYASRVKLITNDAQKNSENKEIARLKQVRSTHTNPPHTTNIKNSTLVFQLIAKLKSGEAVIEEDDL
jgi:serine/threonine-protein kinase RIO1